MSAAAANTVALTVDGRAISVVAGSSVAAAIAHASGTCRQSRTGEPRAPLCGMGVCFECRATVDGHAQRRTCLLQATEGMEVRTDG